MDSFRANEPHSIGGISMDARAGLSVGLQQGTAAVDGRWAFLGVLVPLMLRFTRCPPCSRTAAD